MLEENKLDADGIRDLKYSASSLYGGGADTTVSAEYAFYLAMVLFPGTLRLLYRLGSVLTIYCIVDVQKKAQAEVDSVVGRDRLPNYADIAQLPYVTAVVTEVLRWHNVAPIGVPHRAIEDGIISGYFVPKDAFVMCNFWYSPFRLGYCGEPYLLIIIGK